MDGDGALRRAVGVDVALAEALDLEEPVPRPARGYLVVALVERSRDRRVGRRRSRIVNVHVDELGPEGAAERRAEVPGLDPEGNRGAVIEDLEALKVEGARVEVGRGRVSVIARSVVVVIRVAEVKQLRARDEIEHHGPRGVRGCAARADGDDVEDRGAAADRDVDAEAAIGGSWG